MKALWAAAVAVVVTCVTGCTSGPQIMPLQAPFDAAAAKRQLAPGSNTVHGSGLIRQIGGGVVTCAGGTVFLMPATDAAKEWAQVLYGSDQGGFFDVGRRSVQFPGADELFGAVRMANCDAQGGFKFDHVADGTFLVFTRITWMAGRLLQGGSVMRSVSLSGGETVDVVLSPT